MISCHEGVLGVVLDFPRLWGLAVRQHEGQAVKGQLGQAVCVHCDRHVSEQSLVACPCHPASPLEL